MVATQAGVHLAGMLKRNSTISTQHVDLSLHDTLYCMYELEFTEHQRSHVLSMHGCQLQLPFGLWSAGVMARLRSNIVIFDT